jgi:predicted nucleic acid-binding protein
VSLIDTSAWVEFLRDTGSLVCLQVEQLLEADAVVCEPVVMEILSGARDETQLADLRRLMARCTTLRTESVDYEVAAALFRQCRRNGRTPRKMVDCLIAAVAIRNDIALLHLDQDFVVLAENSALRLAEA